VPLGSSLAESLSSLSTSRHSLLGFLEFGKTFEVGIDTF
jgi:hypothetical protein